MPKRLPSSRNKLLRGCMMTDDSDWAVIVGAIIGGIAMFIFMVFSTSSAWEVSAIKAGVGQYDPKTGKLVWIDKSTGQPIASTTECTCEKK